jgi:hypothetical protein
MRRARPISKTRFRAGWKKTRVEEVEAYLRRLRKARRKERRSCGRC